VNDIEKRAAGAASVRRQLAHDTRAVHQRLHAHPWISRLASPTLTVPDYRALLEAYRAFAGHVESTRARLDLLRPLTLAPAMDSLGADIDALHGQRGPHAVSVTMRLDDQPSLLGALYVIHGSGFGNRVLERCVRDTLPDAPRDFLRAGTPRALWSQLESELEELSGDSIALSRLTRSATMTFERFDDFVTRYCRAAVGTP